MSGVNVTSQYGEEFDRARLPAIAQNFRSTFEGTPDLRSKLFTLDDKLLGNPMK